MVDKLHYNTTLSQTFSPCGNFLLAGNIYGEIAVFDLNGILNPSKLIDVSPPKPVYHFKTVSDQPVCSLISTSKFLITGTVSEITGWEWSSVTTSRHPKAVWKIQIPALKDTLEKADVNSMVVSDDGTSGSTLLAGCGDKRIHVFSLEDGKHVRSMDGHEDYIHSIHSQGNQLASAGEDGSVRLWDLRQSTVTGIIYPYKNSKAARPHLGKWVGDVAINEDWLVCGGGPRLTLYHLRSLEPMTTFTAPLDTGLHVTQFYDDRVLAGGTCLHFYHLGYTGQVHAQVQTSSTTVYSAVYTEAPHRVMCLAGSSSKIDLCTNFSYRDQVLSFA